MSSLPLSCPRCGCANDPGVECCHRCLQPLAGKTSSKSVPQPSRLQPRQSRLSRRTMLWAVIGGAVVLSTGGYLAYRKLSDPHILTYAYAGNYSGVLDAAWSPDGERVASTAEGDDGAVRIWNATTGEQLVTCTLERPIQGGLPSIGLWDVGGKQVVWSADSKHVLAFVGSLEKQMVQVWNATSGQRVYSFPVTQSPAVAANGDKQLRIIGWALNEHYLAVGKVSIRVEGNPFVEIWEIATGSKIATLTIGQDSGLSPGWVHLVPPIVWGPNEKNLALCYSTGKGVVYEIWDALSGKRVPSLRGMAFAADGMAWSPDGKSLGTVNYEVKTGNKVTQYNVETGDKIKEYPVESNPFALTWSPDGKRVAVASYTGGHYWVPTYGGLAVFDASSGEPLAQYDQGRFDMRVKGMGQMAWSPNGKYLLVLNGQIDIWRMESQ